MAKSKHTIRLISGTHRSRRLPVLDFDGLRPTGDRVRETLFNWLQIHIVNKQVLDLCSGTGALGFEAASRGAHKVVLVEKNQSIARQLNINRQNFEFTNVEVFYSSAYSYLNLVTQKFDIIFIDPPFAENMWQELTELVMEHVRLGGFIYREATIATDLKQLDENWQLYRQKTFGQVKIELWKKVK